jgi:hypothetical protein
MIQETGPSRSHYSRSCEGSDRPRSVVSVGVAARCARGSRSGRRLVGSVLVKGDFDGNIMLRVVGVDIALGVFGLESLHYLRHTGSVGDKCGLDGVLRSGSG